MISSTLNNKNILITGGLGFIGSHFVELINEKFENSTIHIVDYCDYCVSQKTIKLISELNLNSNNNIYIFNLDINHYNLKSEYDYIINFAAKSHVDNSIKHGDSFINSNINGVYNLLDKNKYINSRFLQISTDEVYGSLKKDTVSSLETDILNPSSIYSSTKASADLIALSFQKTHKKDVVITRCTNNFGSRQYNEKLIPLVINNCLNNKKIPIYGDGTNIRQWINVKDHCIQILNVLLYGESGQIYNISPSYEINSELQNIEIIKYIIDYLNADKSLIQFVDDRKGHDLRYSLNGNKLKNLMKNIKFKTNDLNTIFTYKSTFKEDLNSTIDWYVKNIDWWN